MKQKQIMKPWNVMFGMKSANILEEPVASIFNTEDQRDGGSKFLSHFSTFKPDYMTSCH
jgi:hypothetical protein